MQQQLRAHSSRPAAVVLSALLAVLTVFLPTSAKSALASRAPAPAGTTATAVPAAVVRTTVTAESRATAASRATAESRATAAPAARPVLGPADTLPHPFHPFHGFLGRGSGDTAPHRAVGGPGGAVADGGTGEGRDTDPYRPRGPPSRWSTEVIVDA
ncbi:hypothetical protein GA0115233_109114 [Streptomyces sp. DI166]|uniref:hypothetical protein n=1 Tax=Streptomyces sp. DI166 TaxID=1839783 RepID=UPI0007F395BE|nr:hypothetical protein [Streptomyces sp. DI166]SBT94515.1 hypothetical protein GA0115233_109114 [Streptomyces sp. DI166]